MIDYGHYIKYINKIKERRPDYSDMDAICEVSALFMIPWKQLETEYNKWLTTQQEQSTLGR